MRFMKCETCASIIAEGEECYIYDKKVYCTAECLADDVLCVCGEKLTEELARENEIELIKEIEE